MDWVWIISGILFSVVLYLKLKQSIQSCFHYFIFSMLQPILMKLLDYHFNNTNFHPKSTFVRHGHISALLILLRRVTKQNYSLIVPYLPLLLGLCLPKWAAQFSSLKEYPVSRKEGFIYKYSCQFSFAVR